MQRLFDIFLSGLVTAFLSPLFIVLFVVLRLSGEGEVFFRQVRIGKGRRPFNILKFATMLKDSPNIGTGTVTVKNDPRVLPVGAFLRKSKINELPQLLNILAGDMSLIGPRPVAEREFQAYSREIQEVISLVSPGLSGIGSIVFRDEESLIELTGSPEIFYQNTIGPYKGNLEKWYVKNRSIGLYFWLIALTAAAVILPRSRVVWRLFKNLPEPPEILKKQLGYPEKK